MKQAFRSLFTPHNLRSSLRDLLYLTIAAALAAINFNVFLAPNDIAPGGITALTLIITSFTGWPAGLTLLALSIPPVILGYFFLGRISFLVRVGYITLLYTLGVDLIAPYVPTAGITSEPLLNALFGGVIGGIAGGLAFLGRGTFAGTGIVSRILQLKTGVPLTQIYMLIDGSIILLLGFVFGWENALYSLVMLFVWGLATDYVLEGPSVVRTATIVTDFPEEVGQRLIERMGIGVTRWDGRGMYSDRERTILFCTISRPDVRELTTIVSEFDPDAFVVIGQGHTAKGGRVRKVNSKPPRLTDQAEISAQKPLDIDAA